MQLKYVGTSDQSAEFTETSIGTKIVSSSLEVSGEFTETSSGVRLRLGVSDQSGEFTQTANSIKIAVGVSSQELAFLKSTLGELLYEDVIDKDVIVVSARALNLNVATFTEITPSANESYTQRLLHQQQQRMKNRRMR